MKNNLNYDANLILKKHRINVSEKITQKFSLLLNDILSNPNLLYDDGLFFLRYIEENSQTGCQLQKGTKHFSNWLLKNKYTLTENVIYNKLTKIFNCIFNDEKILNLRDYIISEFKLDINYVIPSNITHFTIIINNGRIVRDKDESDTHFKNEVLFSESSPITWLVRTQGYRERLTQRMVQENKFMNMVYHEVCMSKMVRTSLAILCSTSLKKFADGIYENRRILIPQDAKIGIFDGLYGYGGPLNIHLQQEFELNFNQINDIIVEDENNIHSIQSIFGIKHFYHFYEDDWKRIFFIK